MKGSQVADLKKGSKGKDVSALQEKLNKAGAKPKLAVDGIFGKGTEAGVKAFQKKSGLKVTGVAGKDTMAALAGGGKPAKALKWEITKPIEHKKNYDNEVKNRKAYTGFLDELKGDPDAGPDLKEYEAALKSWEATVGALKKPIDELQALKKQFDKAGPDQSKVYDEAKKKDEQIIGLFDDWSGDLTTMMDIHADYQSGKKSREELKWPVKVDVPASIKQADKIREENRKAYLANSKICAKHEGKIFEKLREDLFRFNNEAEVGYTDYKRSLESLGKLKDEFEKVKSSDRAKAKELIKKGTEEEKAGVKHLKTWREIAKRREEFEDLLRAALDDEKTAKAGG